ncbi:IS701 family transposase [Streptomyces sp. BI20]|uniref:IS701 family transposase n=1 Tax=Streptomyces sp. BI20 TaxID=3403460 RepID=UPI003C716396
MTEIPPSRVFASLPRRDQRHWAEVYLAGLARAEGRKSVRTIAGAATPRGAGSVEQSLHQFIGNSPWDWGPVRRALARRLHAVLSPPPAAWVVRPLVIEKTGDRSVGVGRQFVPGLGRTLNCQQANTVWLAAPQGAFPVEWSLVLPPAWTEEAARRSVGLPDTARALTPTADALRVVRRMALGWGLPPLPVLWEPAAAELAGAVSTLLRHGPRFVLRIAPGTALLPEPPDRGRDRDRGPADAAALLAAARVRRGSDGTHPVVSVRVRGPFGERDGSRGPVLTLFGPADAAGGHWLTDLHRAGPGELARLTALEDRAARDAAEVCEGLGLRDYEGRSHRGWHHHLTLVGVAHANALLARIGPDGPASGRPSGPVEETRGEQRERARTGPTGPPGRAPRGTRPPARTEGGAAPASGARTGPCVPGTPCGGDPGER